MEPILSAVAPPDSESDGGKDITHPHLPLRQVQAGEFQAWLKHRKRQWKDKQRAGKEEEEEEEEEEESDDEITGEIPHLPLSNVQGGQFQAWLKHRKRMWKGKSRADQREDAKKKLDSSMVVVKVKCDGKALPGAAVMTTRELELSETFAFKMAKTKNGTVAAKQRSVCVVLAVQGGIMKIGDKKSGMALSFAVSDTNNWYHYESTVQDEIDQKQRR